MQEPGAEPIRVLIADDHPMVREGLRAMLRTRGIKVVGEATSGREAVEAALALEPDVVLMDIQMPDMDGIEATRAVREARPGSKVIILTSYENEGYLRKALEAGATGYLLKGSSREVILAGVKLAHEGGSLVSEPALLHMLGKGQEGQQETTQAGLLESLTATEKRVLALVAQGQTNREIAEQLFYSVGTVKNIVQRITEKLGAADRTQAAVMAVRLGLVEAEAEE